MWRADTSVVLAQVMTAAVASMVAQHGYSPAEIAEGGRLFQSSCARCHGADGDAVAGMNFGWGHRAVSGWARRGTLTINRRIPEQGYGAIQAFDPKTGTRRWIYKRPISPTVAC
jgi:mono/diheme cytochrome c family protein